MSMASLRKSLTLLAVLVTLVALVTLGCAGHPAGFRAPRGLSAEEKDLVTRLAAEGTMPYSQAAVATELTWAVITWHGSETGGVQFLRTDVPVSRVFDGVPGSGSWYPAVEFTLPDGYPVWAAVDLPTRKVVYVFAQTHGIVPGPAPTKGP